MSIKKILEGMKNRMAEENICGDLDQSIMDP